MKTQVVNEPDIWDAMLKIREQLMALDRKLDLVLARVSTQSSNANQPPAAQSFPKPFVPPVKAQAQGRPMFRATCADCQKECELPFKPSGDRPVYCKECFAKRKAGNAFKPAFVNKPQAPVATPAAVIPAVVNVPKKKKPAVAKKSAAKKPAAKKMPVAKKRK